jgi:PAS domain S-box-containing protein
VSVNEPSRGSNTWLAPIIQRTRQIPTHKIGDRLDWLERALPFAIVISVLVYEILTEFVLQDFIPDWINFALNNLIFGVFGAFVTIMTLEWLRSHLEAEAKREDQSNAHARQLAAISSDSADAILFVGNDGTIASWNRGAELLFGYRSEEVTGKHFQFLLPKELRDRGELDYLDDELRKNGYIRGYVTKRLTKDGRVIKVELTRTLLRDETGAVIGSSAILRDVTEREQVQEQTRELNRVLEAQVAKRTRELLLANDELARGKRELEKANAELRQLDQLKSEFVSMVSHELRAPLANISGVFQLMLEDDRDSLSINQRELASLANEQVERLGRLVKGVLNVSRIQAGEVEFNLQAFDLGELLENECSRWLASDTRHRYVLQVSSDLPTVQADRDRVEEVLSNLVDNAAKYSSEGTSICIAAQACGAEAVISIHDEGVGVGSEDMKKIFEKFYRVERNDARQTYGHGLGLYISRQYILSMSGRLWVDSKVGQGSTFYFSLPLAEKIDSKTEPLVKA